MRAQCPINRDEFSAKAVPVTLIIGGNEYIAEVKEFATGSFGWYYGGKASMKVGEKTLHVQVGCNLTVVGSKESN